MRAHGSPIGLRVGLGERAGAERKTRYLKTTPIADKSAAASVRAQWGMFAPLPKRARISVTMDNGSEFAGHALLVESLGIPTCFADPYSSYQRGTNENRNGVIRRHPPKRTAITMDIAGTAGDRRRDRQPAHAGAGIPHPGRGLHGRTAEVPPTTKALHLYLDNELAPSVVQFTSLRRPLSVRRKTNNENH